MRIGSIQPGRPEYYDRSPLSQSQTFEVGDVAPHVSVARWTYTVPTNKKSYGQTAHVGWMRKTAAAPAGIVTAAITFQPNAGTKVFFIERKSIDNVVGSSHENETTGSGMMAAGDILQAETADGSTGGTIDYRVCASQIEFDA